MRSLPVHVISILLVCASCDDVLRPAAIIPWSQYQQRLRQANELTEAYYEMEEKWPSQRPTYNSRLRGRWPQRESQPESTDMVDMKSRPRPVFRSQVRNRVPTESPPTTSATSRSYLVAKKKPIAKPEYIATTRTYHMPHGANGAPPRTQNTQLRSIAIPNGVPVHAGTWDDGTPHYATQKRPQQFAVATLESSNPLNALSQTHFASSPLNTEAVDSFANSIFSQSKAASQFSNAAASPVQLAKSPANPLDSILGGGAPLDQISKIASNILNFGGGDGAAKGGLLEAMTNVFRRGSLPAPSTSFQSDFPFGTATKPQPTIMEKIITQAASALNQSFKDKEIKPQEVHLTKDKEDSLKLLDNLPEEERKLLKAAITSGELDAETLAPALKSLVKEDMGEESKKEKESRLIEWIRENRPTKKQKEIKVSADKLPYYGKYCGSFAEQPNPKKKFKPSGALWVVDEQRFIVSKFVFQPGSLLSENVTFWLGPQTHTENILADMFPSQNGFYVRPQPIDVSIFALQELPPIKAKARKSSLAINGTLPIEPVKDKVKKTEVALRVKRDAEEKSTAVLKKPVKLIVKEGSVQLLEEDAGDLPSQSSQQGEVQTASSSSPVNTIGPIGFRVLQPEDDKINYNQAQPLEWYAGFQPLLLHLPSGREAKSLHWISLRDHKRQETVASVLLPNGPAFQIPSVVTLRGLSPNGGYNVSSGQLKVTDIKTIEISNFTLKTGGSAVWFMIGKDILPNAQGHIVPIYDPQMNLFDCESLRDYYEETVLLRLPGNLDIKDVFWFSVFSIANAVSYSHIYLPFNDMQLPPDLSGISTPTCSPSVCNSALCRCENGAMRHQPLKRQLSDRRGDRPINDAALTLLCYRRRSLSSPSIKPNGFVVSVLVFVV
ncbi:unnamed protein product [Cylicocyclus nassatus]|uniref:DM13 domain-containing protein n=1 Tax=Cylicocyclus nassatus TaxID=53992 RepID=A0AA36HF08_CYLNA|nr:unnamed protein product [Cylicocyclus nassatus]